MQLHEYIDSDVHSSFDSGAPFNRAEGAKEKWVNAGWWAKFTAIFIGVLLIFCLIGLSVGAFATIANQVGVQLLMILFVLVLLAFWAREVWLFGNDVRVGIKHNDMNRFNKGLGHLKTYFILLVVSLVLSLLYQLYGLTINPAEKNKELKELLESKE